MYITQCILNRDLKHLYISINQDSETIPVKVLFYADKIPDTYFNNPDATIEWESDTYETTLDLEETNIDFSKSFVFVVLEYEEDETKHIFTTIFNIYRIYDFFMNCIRELNTDSDSFESKCNNNTKNFTDMYLRFKAIDIAIKSKHYDTALNFYNKFFNKELKTSKCRCNG